MKEKLHKITEDFFKGLSNERGGMSLKKLLAVGFFWLTCVICIEFTTKDNVTYVIGILTATILALMGINQLGKQSMKKLDAEDGTTQQTLANEENKDKVG